MHCETNSRYFAKDYLDPDGPIIGSARLFGERIRQDLETGVPTIEISFVGTRGLTTGYFNTLLRLILPAVNAEEFSMRVTCSFDSAIQRAAFDQSWGAVSKEAAQR